MPGSFKLRLLIAIVMLTGLGLLAQSTGGRGFIEPALTYTYATDYSQRIADSLNAWAPLPGRAQGTAIPAASAELIKRPCEIIAVEKSYGWQWNAAQSRRELFPGIFVRLAEDSFVYPILPGTVDEVDDTDGVRQVKITHDGGMKSIYAGLKQVNVAAGQQLSGNECLGSSGPYLYFELQNREQPVDPSNIFIE
ncbi:MAG: M23 family metallopeptidase [Syntrophomonadaceae bacterium]|nr:M23 family metallopeptidase [Syntrophomonadaceae bacterium]